MERLNAVVLNPQMETETNQINRAIENDRQNGYFKDTHAIFVDVELCMVIVVSLQTPYYSTMRTKNHLTGGEYECREIAKYVFQ